MFNCDCMDLMRSGKTWDLAIVDPPYGIGRDGGETGKHWKYYDPKEWDIEAPNEFYFRALFYSCDNQVIWGANYFTKFLPPSMGWVVWDKGQKLTMSDSELAFTSFDRALRNYTLNRCEIHKYGGGLHPTQKPVKLYKWLLTNYAKEGDTILDTHGGSMSIAIACWDLGFDLDICELDKDYFDAAAKRFEDHIAQTTLF